MSVAADENAITQAITYYNANGNMDSFSVDYGSMVAAMGGAIVGDLTEADVNGIIEDIDEDLADTDPAEFIDDVANELAADYTEDAIDDEISADDDSGDFSDDSNDDGYGDDYPSDPYEE